MAWPFLNSMSVLPKDQVLEPVKDECRKLAEDVVQYATKGDQKRQFNSHSRTLLRTVQEVLQRHEILFGSMIQKLDMVDNKKGGKETFERVASEIFADRKYNWGRLVTVYALAARFAQYYQQSHFNNRESYFSSVAEWTGDFVVEHLSVWIYNQGGWNAFDKYFEENPTEKIIWRGMLATAAVGIGALVAVMVR